MQFEKTGKVEEKRRSGRLTKISGVNEQYLKDRSLRNWRWVSSNGLTQDLKGVSVPSLDASTVR